MFMHLHLQEMRFFAKLSVLHKKKVRMYLQNSGKKVTYKCTREQ